MAGRDRHVQPTPFVSAIQRQLLGVSHNRHSAKTAREIGNSRFSAQRQTMGTLNGTVLRGEQMPMSGRV